MSGIKLKQIGIYKVRGRKFKDGTIKQFLVTIPKIMEKYGWKIGDYVKMSIDESGKYIVLRNFTLEERINRSASKNLA